MYMKHEHGGMLQMDPEWPKHNDRIVSALCTDVIFGT